MADIVYILRNGIEGDELRYSLRSLKNFPHDKVWFFGGVPKGLKPDRQVEIVQSGVSVWEKVTSTIKIVCNTEEVSDDFWLFNDDFFVMKPVENPMPIYDGTLWTRCNQIRERNGGNTSLYSMELDRLREMLTAKRLRSYNYAVHMPMLINKKKALRTINAYPNCPMFRSLYGNVNKVGGIEMPDCKVLSHTEVPSGLTYLSTTDSSFANGAVGKYIRSQFTKQSRFEK